MHSKFNVYADTPKQSIAQSDLEECGDIRMNILATITSSDVNKIFSITQSNVLLQLIEELNQLNSEADNISHHILRLAFCQQRDVQEWFINVESLLFKFQLQQAINHHVITVNTFLDNIGIIYEHISSLKLSSYEKKWWKLMHESNSTFPQYFYKVPYNEAFTLISERKALVKFGFALLSENELVYAAVYHFKRLLQHQIGILERSLAIKALELEQLSSLLHHFKEKAQVLIHRSDSSDRYILENKVQRLITPHNIDVSVDKYFPLCMQHLHEKLMENHHLKYDGRLQYRLFLKGLGWSVHETLAFFRQQFIQSVGQRKFDTEYAYHIRHSYGLEGSRINYNSMDCQTIIKKLSPPRQGQYHGCPYVYWDDTVLQNMISSQGLLQPGNPQSQIIFTEILELKQKGVPTDACKLHFRLRYGLQYSTGHDQSPQLSMHPNMYVKQAVSTTNNR